MAKAVKKKSAKKASDVFHGIMKASVAAIQSRKKLLLNQTLKYYHFGIAAKEIVGKKRKVSTFIRKKG